MWIIVIRALLSWVNPDPWNPIVRFLYQVTEPVLRPIRQRLPAAGIDFSPLVIASMRERTCALYPQLKWLVADVTNMHALASAR